MRKSKKQMSESYFIGSLLAIVGGFVDAYTYISRGKVFANAQTGNMVLLGVSLLDGNILGALRYLIPIIAFWLGIVLCEKIRDITNKGHLHWRQYIIMLEMAILILVTFLPSNNKSSYIYDMTANVLISFVCSLQVQSFRKIRGIICATTMCTGNLRSGTECLVNYSRTKQSEQLHKAGKYYGIVLFFIIGAIIGAFLSKIFMEKSVIFCAFILLTVFLFMLTKPEEIK